MIEIDGREDEISAIRVNGEALRSDDGETWFLPKGLISPDMLVNELPEHATFEFCERIEGDIRLGVELWKPGEAENEKDFTLRMVLPILRKLAFQNVRYHHGKREFGRDVLFARFTEFQELEHWGAQVKFGDVNGGASSEI